MKYASVYYNMVCWCIMWYVWVQYGTLATARYFSMTMNDNEYYSEVRRCTIFYVGVKCGVLFSVAYLKIYKSFRNKKENVITQQ